MNINIITDACTFEELNEVLQPYDLSVVEDESDYKFVILLHGSGERYKGNWYGNNIYISYIEVHYSYDEKTERAHIVRDEDGFSMYVGIYDEEYKKSIASVVSRLNDAIKAGITFYSFMEGSRDEFGARIWEYIKCDKSVEYWGKRIADTKEEFEQEGYTVTPLVPQISPIDGKILDPYIKVILRYCKDDFNVINYKKYLE